MTPPASTEPMHCDHERVCWFAHGGMRPDGVFEHPCRIPCKHDTRSRGSVASPHNQNDVPIFTYDQVTDAICFFHANGRAPTISELKRGISINPVAQQAPAEEPLSLCCRDGGKVDCKDMIFLDINGSAHCIRGRRAAAQAREGVLKEFAWMKPACFGRHEAACDTKCAWIVRKRCVESLHSEVGK